MLLALVTFKLPTAYIDLTPAPNDRDEEDSYGRKQIWVNWNSYAGIILGMASAN